MVTLWKSMIPLKGMLVFVLELLYLCVLKSNHKPSISIYVNLQSHPALSNGLMFHAPSPDFAGASFKRLQPRSPAQAGDGGSNQWAEEKASGAWKTSVPSGGEIDDAWASACSFAGLWFVAYTPYLDGFLQCASNITERAMNTDKPYEILLVRMMEVRVRKTFSGIVWEQVEGHIRKLFS